MKSKVIKTIFILIILIILVSINTETLAWWGGGTVTTAARDLFFSIPVSKKMTKISKITATIIHLDIRQNNV